MRQCKMRRKWALRTAPKKASLFAPHAKKIIYLLLRLHFCAARIRADLFFIYETEISTTFALGAFAPRASRSAHSLHAPNFYETDP